MNLVGNLVKVEGKSQKGKNRVHEYGVVWIVKKQWVNDLLIESVGSDKVGLRWVYGIDDPDFKLTLVNAFEVL